MRSPREESQQIEPVNCSVFLPLLISLENTLVNSFSVASAGNGRNQASLVSHQGVRLDDYGCYIFFCDFPFPCCGRKDFGAAGHHAAMLPVETLCQKL